ncbi:MAG TPA: signal peptidase I [Candidatus Saccharimonadales bacterium]
MNDDNTNSHNPSPAPQLGPAPEPQQPQITSTDPRLLQPQAPQPTTAEAVEEHGDGTAGEGHKKHSGWREFGAFIGILGIAALLALFLILFVFRSYAVDGPSMETTLQHQDKLLIWKVPRTIARITGNQYIPNRGDVIIFDESDLGPCGQFGKRQLIKRVIALPGERVTIQDGTYVVYNKSNPDGFKPDSELPYNKDGHIPRTSGDTDVTLTDTQVFVSGDNRPESCDSRNFGPIESDQIIGKLVVRLLPANKIKLF